MTYDFHKAGYMATTIELNRELKQLLEDLKRAEGRKAGPIIRQALSEYGARKRHPLKSKSVKKAKVKK